MGIKFPVNFSANAQNPNTAWGLARPPIQKQKNSLLNSLLIPKNRENPPSPNDLLSKGAKIPDIKASAKASDKTAFCIVLKQRSNSGYYGQVLYLGKRMAVLSDKRELASDCWRRCCRTDESWHQAAGGGAVRQMRARIRLLAEVLSDKA